MPRDKGKTNKDYRREAEYRRVIVAELYRHGYSYREIREEVMNRLGIAKYSLKTVHDDIKALLAEWREMRQLDIDELQQLELQRIEETIKEAWAAWEKSKTDYDKKRSKQFGVPAAKGEGGNGDNSIETTALEQSKEEVVQSGDVRYLDIIHKVSVERRKILGLYAPVKREITGKDGKELTSQFKVEIIDRREQIEGDNDTDDESLCRNPIGFNG